MAETLRLLGISASPRKRANTTFMVQTAMDAACEMTEQIGFDADPQIIELAGHRISPCLGCDQCAIQRRPCVVKDDWQDLAKPLIDPLPDGIVFGSPVYFFNQNALGRAYMERCTSLIKGIWDPETPIPLPDWSCTAAGALAVGADRNGGVEFALTSVLQWFLVLGFSTLGGFYIGGAGWTQMSPGREAVQRDVYAMESARLVGRRVARTAAILQTGRTSLGSRVDHDVTWRSMSAPLIEGGDAEPLHASTTDEQQRTSK